jgi:hypothetical protein
VARPAGFEPATYGLEGRCTIRLCYGRRVRSIPSLSGGAKSVRLSGGLLAEVLLTGDAGKHGAHALIEERLRLDSPVE